MPFPSSTRFEIVNSLGSGAMGHVYEAVDRETNTRVAMKTLRSLDGEGLARFKSEFREFQHLTHPNLVSLGELFEENGVWFFTMELIHGTSLLEWVRGGDERERATRDTAPLPEPLRSDTGDEGEEWQRPWGTFDEGRTRAALLQLAQGLVALHDGGKVHRDLKPENVLVTTDGRVVIVDYGLGIDTEAQRSHDEHEVVGTVAYMSPEQGAARRLTPASDWYAFGSILFECLTGCIPFAGNAVKLLTAKQTRSAPPVRSLAPDAPVDLAGLADALLRHDPHARPHAAEVLAVLSGQTPSPAPSTSTLGQVFVGRAAQSEQLMSLAKAVAAGEGPRVVLLEAGSGLGKTSLLRRFNRRLASEVPSLWRLSGVCYERESSSYKGVDGALDELALLLGELPYDELEALLPEQASLLAEFFPVFGKVVPLSVEPRELSPNRDPVLLRSQLFAALRELLARVAKTRPVLLQIDDVQWASADTFALLRDLLAPPAPPTLLCVFSMRSEDERAPAWREQVTTLAGGAPVHITLDRLSSSEAEALARTLLERLSSNPSAAQAIAKEAAGDPLYIDALVRTHGLGLERPTLDEALWRRSTQLPELAQRVLALVALSKSALEQEVVGRAAGLTRPELGRQIAALAVLHLVRSTGVRKQDTVAPFHDRVRVAMRSRLSNEEAVRLHRQLALALEATPSDLEALAWHWSEAKEPRRAAVYAERAAEKATQRLAFARAAQLYAEAIGTGALGSADTQRLHALRAEALTNAGRGAEAADAFLEAARNAEPTLALGFRQRAAEQLLRSGYIDRGLEALQSVLGSVGERLTTGAANAVFHLLLGRARLAFRGMSFKERSTAQLAPDVLTRIDATWSASNSLTTVDFIRGAEMQTRNLLLTLEAGEPRRVARALTVEASIRAGTPAGRKDGLALLDRAIALVEALDDAHARAVTRLSRGIIEFQSHRFTASADEIAAALTYFETNPQGGWWELSTARFFHLSGLFYRGALDEFAQLVPAHFDEGSRRDDLYAMVNLRLSNFSAIFLMQDDPARALEEAKWALAKWSPRGYLAQHYYGLLARVNAELYRGGGATAFELVETEWGALARSQLFRLFMLKFEGTSMRARAAVAAGTPQSLALAKKLVRELGGYATSVSRTTALALEGAIAHRTGRSDDARRLLEEAATAFEQEGMMSWARAARIVLGGPAADEARRVFRAQGVVQPDAFARTFLPVG